jgi:hypothetical protein
VRAWEAIPGVPAAGHVTAGGWWHPGRSDGCPKCEPRKVPTAKVGALPPCDVCGITARYDAKTTAGPWAYLCEPHFRQLGVGLGTGLGQRLTLD